MPSRASTVVSNCATCRSQSSRRGSQPSQNEFSEQRQRPPEQLRRPFWFALLSGDASLPRQPCRQKLGKEIVVVRLELFQIWLGVALGVEIVLIELQHPLEHR